MADAVAATAPHRPDQQGVTAEDGLMAPARGHDPHESQLAISDRPPARGTGDILRPPVVLGNGLYRTFVNS